ncbi:putative integrase, catalytic core, ribonuclease H domain, ribonuclease H-like superfamily [Helianthus annuus]|nr:putative integrase, catalytic core, ribonuclease H domain, ribonuclease H-like superfamily [Helianthus annuus]
MKPEKGDVLSLYLAVSSKAVSAVLVKDHEGTQYPVCYVSKSLLDAESRYSHLEKLILALIMASTKLRHYFETHVIVVRTNFPTKNVLRKPEMSGRMAKWAVKLSAHDIRYEPRTAIKSQALADFVAGFGSDLQKEAELEVQQLDETKDPWILHTDGSSNIKGTGLGILLKSPQGDIIPHSIACEFQATNNEAEYEALIAGLQIAKHMGIRYLEVPREENTEADALANLGSSLKIPEDISIPIIHILAPAIENQVAMEIEEDSALIPSEDTRSCSGSWISPIMRYLQHGEIPMGENPRAFRIKVSQFTILNNMLYKRSLAGPYLKCIEDPDVQEVLKDFHEGDCGNHTGGRALLSRILRTGYYWPTMKRDAVEYAKKCDPCQRHSNILHQPAEFLHPIPSSWPFMRWGMDIVGKLPKAPGGKVFMLAMTDYFSKWIEAEAFAQVREKEVISFIKRNIITGFGIPSEIICDNGSQFIGRKTTNFCDSWGIKMITSTPVHPQANGQAESSNKIIINNLKKKLGSKKGKWAEELPYVLWADRTTPKNATGQTPFSLVFGAESVIPTEMVVPTARTSTRDPEENDTNLAQDLDTIEEIRDLARIRMASYQQRMAGAYNKNVRIRKFQVGDMVLRKAFQNTTNPADGKLAPKWEGPYLIEAEAGKGAYRLLTMEGNLLPRAWNAVHLKKYFM